MTVGTRLAPDPGAQADHRLARAYCGPAHGRTWALGPDEAPPALVDVDLGPGTAVYRLVRHPRTRRPVRDHLGSYLYMPVQAALVPVQVTLP